VLFNCYGCRVREVEGGSDLSTIPNDEQVELTAGFNLQAVGRIKEATSSGQTVAQRLEFFNEWLPWRDQEVDGGPAALLINLKWKVMGAGKNSATLLVTPWLAFGCSVGARIKTDTGFATVTCVKEDDSCEIIKDNVKEGTRPEVIDPRPDTVGRTTSPTYKANQKLLLLHDGVPVDAIVDEWLGVRKGSRHRVRLVAKGGGKEGAKGDAKSTVVVKPSDKFTLEVDLNESNHAKLLFPTVARYEDARSQYCDKILLGKHATIKDEATAKDLKVMEQRVYVKEFTVARADAPQEDTDDGDGDGAAGERSNSPQNARAREAAEKAEAAAKLAEEKAAAEAAAAVPSVAINNLLDAIVGPVVGRDTRHPPLFIRARSKAEHDLLLNHAMYWLADTLRDPHPKLGPIRLVPIALSAQRLTELSAEESMQKQGARAIIVKAFEMDYPGLADMLRQAMDMRALLIAVEVTNEADLNGLKDAMLEELRQYRLVITCSGINAEGAPLAVPPAISETCQLMQIASIGLYMNESKVSDRLLSNLFKRIRFSTDDASYYRLVNKLHIGSSEVGRGAMQELNDLLGTAECALASLDLSFTPVDGWSLVQSLKRNKSLTSLSLINVPKIDLMYKEIAAALLEKDSVVRLGYLRCDAFDLHEGERHLSLREQPLAPAAMKLLAALLKHNTTCTELDLTASDIEKEGATTLAGSLQFNRTLTALRLSYNPALDNVSRATLRTAAGNWNPALHLDL